MVQRTTSDKAVGDTAVTWYFQFAFDNPQHYFWDTYVHVGCRPLRSQTKNPFEDGGDK